MKAKNLELIKEVKQLVNYSKEMGLDVIGLMCIPPVNVEPDYYFQEMNKLNSDLGFTELSMGMSSIFLSLLKFIDLCQIWIKYFWSERLKNFYLRIFPYYF